MGLKGYILQPDDYVMATYTTKEVNYDFYIEMIDPCETTLLDAFPVSDMETAVHGTADVQILSIPTDSVAALYGD